ncbi:TPA: CDP-alcohol phosphatidyltransferase family protein [Candidatus Geothermarchaeota archaeon]|nr:CDP-alcohol phosphatidyltransferase family protein [Candidatus Geothermarchaeota archaeon]
MLNKLRSRIAKYNRIVVQGLDKVGVSPEVITFLGLFLTILSIIPLIYLTGYIKFIIFIGMILIAGYMDVLDGELARYGDNVSKKGAFIDSTFDRITEVIFILYLYIGKIAQDPILLMLLISTSLLISYVRARAEALGINMQGIGIMERAERIIFILCAIFISNILGFIDIDILLWMIVVLNLVTIGQRMFYIIKKI